MRIRAAMVLRSLVLTLALVNAAYAQVPPDVAKSSAELAAKQAEAIAQAQAKVAEESRRQAEARANAITPIDIEVVVSRYQGDKKISSLPYLLSVNASDRQEKTSLRMGASVPVRNATFGFTRVIAPTSVTRSPPPTTRRTMSRVCPAPLPLLYSTASLLPNRGLDAFIRMVPRARTDLCVRACVGWPVPEPERSTTQHSAPRMPIRPTG